MKYVGLALRSATKNDLDSIVQVHLAAYSRNHFTSRLSNQTLIDYYSLFLSDGAETLVICQQATEADGSDEVLGFSVFGSRIPEKISEFKKSHKLEIVKSSIENPIIASRKLFSQIYNRLAYDSKVKSANYIILSIAVRSKGSGIGRQLLIGTMDKVSLNGERRIGLYVNSDNLTALNAYTKSGFVFKDIIGSQFYMECER